MQAQQVQADRLQRRDRIGEPFLDQVALGPQLRDHVVAPFRDSAVARLTCPRLGPSERVLEHLQPPPHLLRVFFEPVYDSRQVAQLLPRLFRQSFEQLLGRHPDRELRGPVRHRGRRRARRYE